MNDLERSNGNQRSSDPAKGRVRRWLLRVVVALGSLLLVGIGLALMWAWWANTRYVECIEKLRERGVALTRAELQQRTVLPPDRENAAPLFLEAATLLSRYSGNTLQRAAELAQKRGDSRARQFLEAQKELTAGGEIGTSLDSLSRLFEQASNYLSEHSPYDLEALPLFGSAALPAADEEPSLATREAVSAFLGDHDEISVILERAVERPSVVLDTGLSLDWDPSLDRVAEFLALRVADAVWREDRAGLMNPVAALAQLADFRSREPTTMQFMYRFEVCALLFREVRRSVPLLNGMSKKSIKFIRRRIAAIDLGARLEETIRGDRVWMLQSVGEPSIGVATNSPIDRLLLRYWLFDALELLDTLETLAPRMSHQPGLFASVPQVTARSSFYSADRLRAILGPLWVSNFVRWRHSGAEQAIARCALAAVEFQTETGALPGALDELVPAYLKAVPLDPFGEGPLRFRRTQEGAIIYSVGSNGKDEGGSSDDRAFRVMWGP